jgi:Raf kinase inhibitor-like YbhB/YbcL family protein
MTDTEASLAKIKLTSPAFEYEKPIPKLHTCDGKDASPALRWAGGPVSRTLALVCDDPDAPRGTWVHWVLYNLPGETVELAEGVPPSPELPSGARQGKNSWGKPGYGGPCPPPGNPHRYFFRLYALDISLNLGPGATKAELEQAMAQHIVAQGSLMGVYGRGKT